jgi:hypothetical protein
MAVVQLRNPTQGRAYFDGEKAAGKTSMKPCARSSGGNPTSSTPAWSKKSNDETFTCRHL